MNKKIVISGLLVITALLVGSVFSAVQKRNQQEAIVEEVPIYEREQEEVKESLSGQWKIYSNKEYGFEISYPETWTAEGFASAGVGAPIDCESTPEECTDFSVKFSSPDRAQPIVLETFKNVSDSSVDNDEEAAGSPAWKKNIAGREFFKSNSYFPIFGSCFTTAGPEGSTLKKGDVGFYFFSFYEPAGSTMEEMEDFCSREIPDEIFDKIVGSFTSIE